MPLPNEPPAGFGETGPQPAIDELFDLLAARKRIDALTAKLADRDNRVKWLEDVPVLVASGPYKDANETWRMIGLEHGRKLAKEDHLAADELLRDAVRLIDKFRECNTGVGSFAVRQECIEWLARAAALGIVPAGQKQDESK